MSDRRRRPVRHDVDDPAHRVVAVQARRGAVDDFDALGIHHRHARPVDPAAERIVERNVVEQHEGAADAARSDAAQRHALRRRIRRNAAGSPEQAERRHLPQHVVGDDRRRPLDLLVGHDVDAGRHVGDELFRARRRHDELLGVACGPEPDFNGLRHLGRHIHGDVLHLEARRRHAHRVGARRQIQSARTARSSSRPCG